METERFEAIVETYGTEPSRWPAEERAAALLLLDESPAARDIMNRERDLDMFLAAAPQPGAEMLASVRARVMGKVQPGLPDLIVGWFEQATWRSAAVACLPLMLGVAIGMGTADDTVYTLEQSEEIALMAINSNGTGWLYDEQ